LTVTPQIAEDVATERKRLLHQQEGSVSVATGKSAHGLRQIAEHDLAGCGDGMQVQRVDDAVYVGHTGTSGAGTSVLDASDPRNPRLVAQWAAPANTHTHKVQVADGLLLVNHEKFPYRKPAAGPFSAGLAVYSVADPLAPEQVGFWRSGGLGVHRIVWTGGRYAHMSATPEGFRDRIWVVVDLSDPAAPREAGRWWWPGLRDDEVKTWPDGQRFAAHHALLDGNRAYLGLDDGGMVVLDVSDMSAPQMLTRVGWGGGATHTCLPLPGRKLVVVTDEQQHDGPNPPERRIRVLDVSADPRVASVLPMPTGGYDQLPMRFGAHNLHENRAHSYRSERIVFATYFSAGVRVYDLDDPAAPVEMAHWVPDAPAGQPVPQSNDLFVDDDDLTWVTDRVGGGLAVLEPEPWLREAMHEAAA
jgi:hypothetical protein